MIVSVVLCWGKVSPCRASTLCAGTWKVGLVRAQEDQDKYADLHITEQDAEAQQGEGHAEPGRARMQIFRPSLCCPSHDLPPRRGACSLMTNVHHSVTHGPRARADAPRRLLLSFPLLRLSPGGKKCVTLAFPPLPTYGNPPNPRLSQPSSGSTSDTSFLREGVK